MSVTGIDATYYTARDYDALTEFYTKLLGSKPAMQVPGMISEWTFADGNSFGLYHGEEPSTLKSGSVMFKVADVAAAVAEAKKSGVHFHSDGEVTDTPGCHMAFGEDPEGNQFILHAQKH